MTNLPFDQVAQDLRSAGIDPAQVDPHIVVGHRINGAETTWVVSVNAATNNTFELPKDVSLTAVFVIAQAVIKWDIAMMEGQKLSSEDYILTAKAALAMIDGPVRRMIIGEQ
ncbi:hypothetical protein [Pseudomonas sp. R5(2019)]|uniref:hypothetical protein n=1 Tax=Pseudomonas sp. R5(2019) TaxID=2697566 RepID=UPI001411F742|nr:hypothetical protein [Pseudomonas sp. R5(2019)]NBA95256.1 hypothetical protein [Pseudomonas sp. R5(2019)]